MENSKQEQVTNALVEFVLRAASKEATAEEVAALPAVATLLLKYGC